MTRGFWMHENGMDVCIEIIKVQYSDHKRFKCRVRWWNLGYTGNPWLVDPNATTIEIKRGDHSKWKRIDNLMFITRKESGLPRETV